MAKKLEIGVELKHQRAKRQAEEIGEAVGTGMARAEASSERLAQNVGKASDSFRLSSQQMARAAAGFGGMLLGTAAKAAAANAPEGSSLQKSLEWGGGVAQGAGMGAMLGSMFGPLGTAIGALAGAANALANKFLDEDIKEKEKAKALRDQGVANRELVDSLLKAQERTEKFRDLVDSLGDGGKDKGSRLYSLNEEITKRQEEEERLRSGLKNNSGQFAGEAENKLFKEQLKEYSANHAELERLKAMQKGLEKTPAWEREQFGALDALSRVGGAVAGGDTGMRDLTGLSRRQVALLESIDRKSGKSGRF